MRKPKFKNKKVWQIPGEQDERVPKFVNNLMQDGKRSVAYTIFQKAMSLVKEKTGEEGVEVWKRALDNVMPSVEVKGRRVGGATFQVPIEVRPTRKVSLGMKWLIRYAGERNEHTMSGRLAGEIMAAAQGEGAAVKRKTDTHRMAESNKAFSYFRF